jgi:hypothetical protein
MSSVQVPKASGWTFAPRVNWKTMWLTGDGARPSVEPR